MYIKILYKTTIEQLYGHSLSDDNRKIFLWMADLSLLIVVNMYGIQNIIYKIPWRKKAKEKQWCSSFWIWADQTSHIQWVGITLHSVHWTCCNSKLRKTEKKMHYNVFLECYIKLGEEAMLVWKWHHYKDCKSKSYLWWGWTA